MALTHHQETRTYLFLNQRGFVRGIVEDHEDEKGSTSLQEVKPEAPGASVSQNSFGHSAHYPMAWRATRALAKEFNVLALESSADDTCAAIVTSTRRILSNVVIKQNNMSVGSTSTVLIIPTVDIFTLLDMKYREVFTLSMQ